MKPDLVVIIWRRCGDVPGDIPSLACRGGSALRVFVRDAPDPRTLGVFLPLMLASEGETEEQQEEKAKALREQFVQKLREAEPLPFFDNLPDAGDWMREHHGSLHLCQIPVKLARKLWPGSPEVFYDPREMGWPID